MKRTNGVVRWVGLALILLGFAANPAVAAKILPPYAEISSTVARVLIACEVVAVGLGLLLVVRPEGVRRYFGERKVQLVLAATVFVVTLVVADVGLNLLTPAPYWKTMTKYGWSHAPRESSEQTIQDTSGNFRKVTNTYAANGFKRWGDLASPRPRIVIVGDSFTEMACVSNGEEWYAILEREFPELEFFVCGTGGWGSLQEYMVLDDFIDQIRPDVILWQFCWNDFKNNDYAWDKRTYPWNNFGVRPYLEEGRVVYRTPMVLPGLRKFSRLAAYFLQAFDKRAQKYAQAHPRLSDKSARPDADEARSHAVTLAILKKARERAKGIPFFIFNVSDAETEMEKAIFAEAGLIHIPGVGERVVAKETEGLAVKVVGDGHWNLTGNQLAGADLAERLRKQPAFMQVLTRQETGSHH